MTLYPTFLALLSLLSDFLLQTKGETRVTLLVWEREPGTPNNFFGISEMVMQPESGDKDRMMLKGTESGRQDLGSRKTVL